MANIPASIKSFQQYIRRAEELEKNSNSRDCQVVAYYCRFYAVSKISKTPEASQSDVQSFLFSQMDIMERIKPTLKFSPGEKPFDVCRGFAESVFQKADLEDGSGNSDKGTAKIFYSAGTFLEILDQFEEKDEEVAAMRKYAKWRASDIMAALAEGRRPAPAGFTGADDGASGADEPALHNAQSQEPQQQSSGSPYNSGTFQNMIPAPPSTNPQIHMAPAPPFAAPSPPPTASIPPPALAQAPVYHQPLPVQPQQQQPQQQQLQPVPIQRPAAVYTSAPAVNTDPRVKDSMELAQFAVAAMKQNNLQLARERLAEAMARLG